jgi:hypothetical protein
METGPCHLEGTATKAAQAVHAVGCSSSRGANSLSFGYCKSKRAAANAKLLASSYMAAYSPCCCSHRGHTAACRKRAVPHYFFLAVGAFANELPLRAAAGLCAMSDIENEMVLAADLDDDEVSASQSSRQPSSGHGM